MVTIAELRARYADTPAPIPVKHVGPSRAARRGNGRSTQFGGISRFYRMIGNGKGYRFRRRLVVARIIKQMKIERRLPVVADLCPIIMSFNVLHGVEAWISLRLGLNPPNGLFGIGSSVLPSSPPAAPPPTPPALPNQQHPILMLRVVAPVREAA
jgi:hypothetical protein